MSTRLEVLNPRGRAPTISCAPLTARPLNLQNKTLWLIKSWAAGSGFERLLNAVAQVAQVEHPGITVQLMPKPTAYAINDTQFWDQITAGCDAFVYAGAPSASTTHYAVHYTALLEKRGKPGIALAYDTLRTDALNSVEGSGVAVRWHETPYPLETLTEAAVQDMAHLILQQLLAPLQHEETITRAPLTPPAVAATLQGSADELQEAFHETGWTDGLPVVLPTHERVQAMLAGTSHAPDTIVAAAMGPEDWEVSVHQVAVNAVMAGCTPACLPVVLAAVEAFAVAPSINAASFATCARSTNSFSFMQAISGPIRHELGMNAGLNALGPGNRANATIGRALRLAMINLGGVEIGKNAFPVQGNPAAYSFAFAEHEEATPWETFGVSRGYGADDSVLTLFTGGWSHVGNYIEAGLDQLARDIASFESPSGVLVLISPQRARALHESGLNKNDVSDQIWQGARRRAGEFRDDVYWKALIEPNIRLNDERRLWPKEFLDAPDDEMLPIYPREHIHVLVVGGEISPMMQAWKALTPVSVSVDRWR